MRLEPAPGQLPQGRRVYAIGDVHGCAAQLQDLHRQIARDLERRPVASALLLHLGDYVDRGPDSRAVVGLLAGGAPLAGVETVNLMGNHERTMLDALAGERAAATDWLIQGGRQTLASWGADPELGHEAWAATVPRAARDFLGGLALHHREGGYLFVHAGLRPGIALERQAVSDLLSIRASFLYSDADFGAVIVHGHTPQPRPVLRQNRIGLDTGAVFGGPLTCAVLEGDRIGFLTA